MKIFNSDSSKEAKYLEAVERKERAKDILWKHIGPYGIGMTSKFAQASLRAMDEHLTEQLHKLNVIKSVCPVCGGDWDETMDRKICKNCSYKG